ncbi:hypothetical protein QTP70_002189 [Hemibagrus guttatus]|uniref:SPRY domain-containing protein n=1 Tax=Hemibagrus guttatus TaxID=175788 RepID=A0AAE0V8F4_9TELE|nr:hypothetical protein QTP70_002189 [Hemibagrus guttatus]
MLLPCNFLPVDNSCQEKSQTQSKRKRDTHQVDMGNEEDSEDDNDWRSLTARPTKQLAESTSQLRLEEDELQLRGMGEELDQELDDEQAMPTVETCEEGNRSSEKVADVLEDENETAEGGGQETSSDEADDGSPAVSHLPQRKNENQYSAFADPSVPLTLREKVEVVGGFVDYEEGLVSFYDVKSRYHIYSFTVIQVKWSGNTT